MEIVCVSMRERESIDKFIHRINTKHSICADIMRLNLIDANVCGYGRYSGKIADE